ncbi:sugar diacid utilization regulator [Nocardia transvalensis]|uniref:Sugar diacid utilization regulator n=1 Tax=Nocardia transvalensis TaxID=37333 RepID=A0A7W9UKE4_9NOCA|nr:helix-turn-helix domain-containing protein [Nocardia transvalensis]MBB5916232.1 sugar diacid utilization regulator [Nocardia transvalensis]
MITPVPSSATGFDQSVLHACRDLAEAILEGRFLRQKARHIETIATGWAKAGVPLDWIHKQVWESVKQAAQPGSRGAATERADLAALMDTMTSVLAMVSATYLGELRGRSARQRLMSALLNGEDTTGLARECGLTIAGSYAVIALAFPIPRAQQASLAHTTARISSELAHHGGAETLARLSDEGGTILLPAPDDDAALDHLLDELKAATRIPLTAATTSAPPAGLADAAGRAHELLDVALLFGREGTLHRFSDLAAEYQLTRPGPARDQLATILDPLETTPHLSDTLHLYLRGTLSRRAIARHLGIHANTVEYRLKRVAALTGLDPLTQAGQWQLRCAMVARSCSHCPIAR